MAFDLPARRDRREAVRQFHQSCISVLKRPLWLIGESNEASRPHVATVASGLEQIAKSALKP